MEKRLGFEYLDELPEGETVIKMLVFQERLYVATSQRLYLLLDDGLHPVSIAHKRAQS